jgi:soluble lytic murein transglycosylase
MVDYCAGQDDPALAAFTRAIQAGHRVAESRYWAGLAFRSQGDADNTLRQFNLIIQNFSGSSVWGPAWLEKGKTYAIAQDFPSAANVYREFADQYPSRTEAPEALWRAGVAARMSGDASSAQSTWITLTENYPASDWTPAALMWQGKLALAQGQDLTATTFFSRAAAFDPTSYYSVRAAEWLRGEAAPLQPVSATLEFDEPKQRTEAKTWLAARLSISDTTQLRGLRADIAAAPALQRGLELIKLDLLAEADYEFDAVRAAYQSDALALYQLALLFRDVGMYRQSIAAADAVIRLTRTSIADAPPFLARLVYPTYYGDLVAPEAQARGLDPLLVFSVIRQESLFESLSFSTAAAHGLMQIIQPTGQEIANALNWPNYSRTDLYKPYISIKFGTYYLARQRDGLDGDLYAALAAYNGGPGNAARWKSASDDDPDLFYETVSFNETRLYIRRISEYYEVYKKLYAVK